jgi:hypothetical protein
MACYFLPRHVHFCYVGQALVFLDLEHDDYTLVKGDAVAALKAISRVRPTIDPTSQCSAAIRELLDGGLLTTDQYGGRDIAPTHFGVSTEQLVDAESATNGTATAERVFRFIAACTSAALQLRCRTLIQTINAVQARKTKCAAPLDLELARELTATFRRLRGFVPINYVCLYDSLALIEFLAAYRVFPTWVFGVKLEPWAAHCWVQEGRLCFNEDVEEAAGYVPIMTV